MICNPRRLQFHISLDCKVVRSFLTFSLSFLFNIVSVVSRHLDYRARRTDT
ncbi:hypothetical protein Hanom_Chr04g00377001 [Helianthus anomalus]